MDLLTQPKNDINLLNNRKSIITTFIQNPKLYQEIRSKLEGIGKIEGHALWFVKKISPEINFSSDFIVGYPGESQKDFDDTISLIKSVNFINSFSFIYSPRTGTPASRKEMIDIKIQKKRLTILPNLLIPTDSPRAAPGPVVPAAVPLNLSKSVQLYP